MIILPGKFCVVDKMTQTGVTTNNYRRIFIASFPYLLPLWPRFKTFRLPNKLRHHKPGINFYWSESENRFQPGYTKRDKPKVSSTHLNFALYDFGDYWLTCACPKLKGGRQNYFITWKLKSNFTKQINLKLGT